MEDFIEDQIKRNISNRVFIEKSMGKDISDESCLDMLEKAGTKAQLGEVRTWGGKEYIKTPKGWRPKPKGFKEGGEKEGEKNGAKDKGNLPSDAKKVMNALAGVNSKYKDPNLVQVEATPKGNWVVYYDGKYTGTTINGAILSDATVEKLGWEYHDVD